MADINALLTDNIDIWTSAIKTQSTSGRGSRKKLELTGIKKLRELILELAVRGKLVPQDPNDEPASILLEKITAEKEQLIRDKRIKKQKLLPKIMDKDKPFYLPTGWEWVRLQDIIYITSGDGLTAAKMNSEGQIPVFGGNGINGYHNKSNVLKPTIVIGRVGFYCGSIHITPDDAWITDNAFKTVFSEGNINLFFLSWLLKGTNLKENESATAQPVISGRKIYPIVVGLPPLNEQCRIADKIDELMALCDQLEQQSEESITTHQTLVDTLLDALVNPEQDATTFADSWTLIEQNFELLFTTEQSIDKLKQTILQLAVMGKLVPQDPNDEPASVLLKKISAEKELLIKEGKIKKQKLLSVIKENEQELNLAHGWQAIRFGQIINLVSGQHLKPQEYSEISEKGMIPYLTGPADFGAVFPSATRYTYEKRATSKLGDILITCKGSGVGKLNESNEQIAISRQLMAIQPILINTKFAKLLAESLNDHFRDNVVGIAIPGISREDVTEAIIYLPPEVEQHRIVSKVDELMILCDNLKDQFIIKKVTQQNLASAFVEKTLATAP